MPGEGVQPEGYRGLPPAINFSIFAVTAHIATDQSDLTLSSRSF